MAHPLLSKTLCIAILACFALCLSGCFRIEGADSFRGQEDGGESSDTPNRGNNSESPRDGSSTNGSAPQGAIPAEQPKQSGKYVDKTFNDIKFEMEKEEAFERAMLTPEIENLDGKQIRIRGYIYPTAQSRGIKTFILVRDNQECCFGQGAALFDCIVVQMNTGKTARFSIRPVAVEGTFRIKEFIGPSGKHLAIFQLDGDDVR